MCRSLCRFTVMRHFIISFIVSFRAVISAIIIFLSSWHSLAFYCLLRCDLCWQINKFSLYYYCYCCCCYYCVLLLLLLLLLHCVTNKWRHFSGVLSRFRNIYVEFVRNIVPNIIQISLFLTELFEKEECGHFMGTHGTVLLVHTGGAVVA